MSYTDEIVKYDTVGLMSLSQRVTFIYIAQNHLKSFSICTEYNRLSTTLAFTKKEPLSPSVFAALQQRRF